MINNDNKKMINNTLMLYLLTFAKLVLPLLTFPYLTRILSINSYGLVTYVKSCTNYMQLVIDFGFILSATKAIALVNDKKIHSKICSSVTCAKLLLAVICFVVYLLMIVVVPILKINIVFSILSIIPIMLNIFLFDYYFRGIEKMQIVTLRFIVAKTVSVFLTFILIKNDSDLLLIPLIDSITNLGAVISTLIYLKKQKLKIIKVEFRTIINELRSSFVFFISDIASTAFTLINTFLIGIFLTSQDVAYWGVAYTLISAVQSLYNPISNGIYPNMVRTKSLGIIKKIFIIFMPITVVGVLFCYIFAPIIIQIVNGTNYLEAVPIFRNLLLVLLFGFPATILGWPSLGSINKNIYVTKSTIISSLFHVLVLFFLLFFNLFNIYYIALARSCTELLLFILRFHYFRKFKFEFSK